MTMNISLAFSKPHLTLWENIPDYKGWIAEPKLDGMRSFLSVGYQDIKLLRDDGKNKTLGFPEVITKAKSANLIEHSDTIIDGEICILKSPLIADFPAMQKRMTLTDSLKIKLLSSKIPATFVAFDVLKFEGEDLTKEPYSERRKILEKFIPKNPFDVVSQWKSKDLMKEVETKDLEGLVLKEPNSIYEHKRQETWRKFKKRLEGDYIVKDFTSEKRMITALELVDAKGNLVGKVNYTGYPQTEEMKKKLIGMTAVVTYMKSQGKLRIPILKELREK